MYFDYQCIKELNNKGLFHNTDHMTRFSDLVTCYSNYPFFTPGLVKCMYLSSWDDEHYAQILEIINDMTIERSHDTYVMEDNGKTLEFESSGRDYEMFKISNAFLTGDEYVMDRNNLDQEGLRIINNAIVAAMIIDNFFRD